MSVTWSTASTLIWKNQTQIQLKTRKSKRILIEWKNCLLIRAQEYFVSTHQQLQSIISVILENDNFYISDKFKADCLKT